MEIQSLVSSLTKNKPNMWELVILIILGIILYDIKSVKTSVSNHITETTKKIDTLNLNTNQRFDNLNTNSNKRFDNLNTRFDDIYKILLDTKQNKK